MNNKHQTDSTCMNKNGMGLTHTREFTVARPVLSIYTGTHKSKTSINLILDRNSDF